jgi:SAM-dependent methyltransferase
MTTIESWLALHLACPIDHLPVRIEGALLECANGHSYPIVDGVPVMLRDDVPQTIDFVNASIARARGRTAGDPRAPQLYLESLGISEDEKASVVRHATGKGAVDPVVMHLVAATNGLMYRDQIGVLDRYPIPNLRLPEGRGGRLLDVGCSWGRWSIAAARNGYRVIGVDPSLGAVMAARRVAQSLGVDAAFLVGDARYLPLLDGAFDAVFSYSVIQHFSKTDAGRAVAEMSRVLQRGGIAKVQMPSRWGARCLYQQWRRGFREPDDFDVRYWSLPELRRAFAAGFARIGFEVDCYFGIGIQPSDRDLMSPLRKGVVTASETLRKISAVLPPLVWAADSVYVEAVKPS